MIDLDVMRQLAARDPRYCKYLPESERPAGWQTMKRHLVSLDCIHRGEPTGETEKCEPCGGNVKLKLFACAVHQTCTLAKRVPGHGCCDARCKEREVPA